MILDIIQQEKNRIVYALLITNIISILMSFSIGLFLFGWWLTPIRYTPGGYETLATSYKQEVVYTQADLHAFTLDPLRAKAVVGWWGGDNMACELADIEKNLAQRARLIALAYAVNGYGCVREE